MTRILFAALLATAASTGLSAATYTVVWDQVSPSGPNLVFSPSATPAFTGDFSLDKTLELVYTAPAGYHFSGSGSPTFVADFGLLLQPQSVQSTQYPGQVLFDGATGQLTPVGTPVLVTFNDGSIYLQGSGDCQGSCTFHTLRLIVPIPSTLNTVFSNVVPIVHLLAWSPTSFTATLEPDAASVPEPAPSAFLLTGSALILLARRARLCQ